MKTTYFLYNKTVKKDDKILHLFGNRNLICIKILKDVWTCLSNFQSQIMLYFNEYNELTQYSIGRADRVPAETDEDDADKIPVSWNTLNGFFDIFGFIGMY